MMGKLERLDLWLGSAVGVMAAFWRVPTWLSATPLTFDEGVFLASADLARSGLAQYRDFFTSQGPLFIPFLRVGQIVSFGDPRGPRTIMVVAGVAASVAMYFILRSLTTRSRAFWLSIPVAVSGSMLLAAGPVQSDGLALALGLGALALILNTDTRKTAVLAGVMLGASVATKSLHTVPFIIVAVFILLTARRGFDLAMAALAGVAVTLITVLAAGPELVWDQYVLFHLAKDNTVDLTANLPHLGQLLSGEDAPLVLLGVTTAFSMVAYPRRRYTPWMLPTLWLAVTAIVFVGFTSIDPGFARTIGFFVPPIVALIAVAERLPIRLLALVAFLALPVQVLTSVYSPEPTSIEAAAVDAMRDVPPGRLIVSDDPGLIWAAGQFSHPNTVDPSFARFKTGYLNASQVRAALDDPATCLYANTSGRFEFNGVDRPASYLQTSVPGVFRRSNC